MEPDKTQIAPDDLQHLAQTLDIKLKEADLAKRQSDLAGGGLWKNFFIVAPQFNFAYRIGGPLGDAAKFISSVEADASVRA